MKLYRIIARIGQEPSVCIGETEDAAKAISIADYYSTKLQAIYNVASVYIDTDEVPHETI